MADVGSLLKVCALDGGKGQLELPFHSYSRPRLYTNCNDLQY